MVHFENVPKGPKGQLMPSTAQNIEPMGIGTAGVQQVSPLTQPQNPLQLIGTRSPYLRAIVGVIHLNAIEAQHFSSGDQ